MQPDDDYRYRHYSSLQSLSPAEQLAQDQTAAQLAQSLLAAAPALILPVRSLVSLVKALATRTGVRRSRRQTVPFGSPFGYNGEMGGER